MRAAALNSYQGVKVRFLNDRNFVDVSSWESQGVSVQDVEEPELVNLSQVLIEVRAASLDPVDLKVSLTSFLTFQIC